MTPTATSSENPSHTSSSTASSTPTPVYGLADCPQGNGSVYQDQIHAMSSGYLKLCSSYFVESNTENLIDGPTATFNDCILMCDSVRIWNNTYYEMNAVVYNPTGYGNQPLGNCWCVHHTDLSITPDGYYDVAILSGGRGG